MSEEKKEAYEVGIPIEKLSSEEQNTDDGIENALMEIESGASHDPSVLPDLFDPEELAEVGLTAELAETIENGEGEEGESPANESMDAHASPGDRSDPDVDVIADSPLKSESLAADPSVDSSDGETAPASDETETDAIAEDENSFAVDGGPSFSDDIHDEFRDVDADAGADLSPGPHEVFIDQDLLAGRLESLSLQIAGLQREFEGKLKYDAHKDEVIDRLHSELQEYKQDIIKKYVLSIVMDVVKVADDIRKWLTYFRSLEVSQRDPRKLFRYLEAIPSDLEDVFYWHGVKPFASEEGPFDPVRQRAIKKIPTDDMAQDKNVAHSIRPGYEWETKVIRQEMVAVYVYQEEQESLNTGMIDE
jgi:molecular chaperone GrpE